MNPANKDGSTFPSLQTSCMKFDVVPVLLLPADGRSGHASLYCDLGLQLEGQSTTHFPLKKNTWTHAQRSTFPLSVSHTALGPHRGRERQLQSKATAEQVKGNQQLIQVKKVSR